MAHRANFVLFVSTFGVSNPGIGDENCKPMHKASAFAHEIQRAPLGETSRGGKIFARTTHDTSSEGIGGDCDGYKRLQADSGIQTLYTRWRIHAQGRKGRKSRAAFGSHTLWTSLTHREAHRGRGFLCCKICHASTALLDPLHRPNQALRHLEIHNTNVAEKPPPLYTA